MDINAKVLAAFQVEHKEQLEGIRSSLAVREKDNGPAGAAALDEAFRLAHSLKGGARVCDLQAVETLGHRLEALFSGVRQGSLRFDKGVVEVSILALEAIEDWMAALAQDRTPSDPARAIAAIDRTLNARPDSPARPAPPADIKTRVRAAYQTEHKQHLAALRSFLADREKDNGTGADLDEALRLVNSLKGGARVAELPAVEALGQRLESLFLKARDDPSRLDRDATRSAHALFTAVEDAMAALAEGRTPSEPAPAPSPSPTELTVRTAQSAMTATATAAPQVEMLRLSAEHLDRLLRSSGQLLTESLRQDQVARELSELSRQVESLDREWESVRKVSATQLNRLGTMPEYARLVRYLEFAAQQMRAQVRQARRARLLQQRSSWSLRILGEEVQHDVRRARMVPADSVFQGFRKMVRDLARDEGKEIEFRVTGFDVQADRLVLQALKDPLMHMLRNAVIHGIEPPDERTRLGKSECGRVTLRIETPGQRLSILVDDDGRGIDRGRVADVAVRRGLLSEAEAADASADELSRLIFQPGFSTSRVVNELAGRGMGLSVVFETVSRLRGEVHLEERPGPGSSILITVPLSISTHRLLLVSCRAQTFAIPLSGIEQLLRVKLSDVETVEGKPMVLLRGHPVPLLSLAHLIGMNDPEFQVEGDSLLVAVLKSGTKRVAVGVEAFLAERDAIIKDLDGPAAHLRSLAGGILLEDGSVALVLNPTHLVENYKPSHKTPAIKVVATRPEQKAPTVLVVDDSFTTRTLEKSILEAHGYQVRIAMDGQEALDRLRAERFDLVITDVQMPRMDGLSLLQAIKKDPNLASLPVILVTSMDRREDQERGLALGADAYIVKRKFDHQDLLNTIQQIL